MFTVSLYNSIAHFYQTVIGVNLELPDVNLELHSPSPLTEHDALTVRESQLQNTQVSFDNSCP